MRDILVTILILGSLPFILKRPYVGVLVWSWISYMNPHRLTWSFAYDFPFAQVVAITVLLSLLMNKEKKSIPVDGVLIIWVLFLVWITITTIFAIHGDLALENYESAIKIQFFTFITMMCMRDLRRIHLLIVVICLSIGFFSIKGGVFTILTGGKFWVYGPPHSFLSENNALALATLMVIPLMYYLSVVSEHKYLKWAWLAAIFLSGASVLGSQSRGAFLAIVALGSFHWWQSKTKVVSGVAIIILASVGFAFMPQSWHDRMNTMRNYEDDPSASARITAWQLSKNIADVRLTGGGFNTYTQYTYTKYLYPVERAFVAHSIYFSVLGSHGWPGLIMFLSILGLTWRSLSQTEKRTRDEPQHFSMNVLSRMLKLSLLVYMTGGAFLSLAYFDLPWHVIALSCLLKNQLKQKNLPRVQPEPGRRNLPNNGQRPEYNGSTQVI